MATFNDINPQLKAYLLKHRLPDIFECIFTALAASKPADPNKFILEKLRDYQEGKHFDLAWDSFVSRKDLPSRRVFKRTFIENFFTLEDLAELQRVMATFNDINPQLKAYLLKHRLPDIFECIFTALAASKPADPNKFILEKLRDYQEGKHFDLAWDSFVSRKDLPSRRVFKRTFIENFFTLEDLAELESYLSSEDYHNLRYYFYFQPSEEQKRLAAQAYNDALLKKHFRAWLGFYNRKKEKRRKALEEWRRAVQFHKHKLMVSTFQVWHAWKCERYRSQQEAAPILAAKMRKICLQNAIYTTFRAWQQVTKHASDTNKWFKKYEILNSDDEDEVKDKAVGQDFISKLPHKASNRIFSFLNVLDRLTCSLVCRSWKIMVQDRSLWTQIDLQRIKDQTTDRLVANLAHKFRSFLCNLNLRDCVRVTSSSLRYIGECRNLQELSLSGIKQINADVVNDIGLGCKNLLYLNIAKCHFDDGVLRVLARHYVNIQYLSLAGCTGFSTAGVYYFMVGQGLHKLFHLDISGCSQITHEGMRYIARGCPLLHSLALNKLAMMKDESLYFFTKYCPNLKALHLRHASSLTDTAFMYIADNLPRLKTLCVEGNHNITGASIKMVGRGCPDLVHLFIIDCIQMCDTGLKGFSSTRGLRVVNLGDCIRISDHGVRNIVDGPSGPHIRELNLTNCLRVGDTTLFRIAQRCQSLAYVSFCYSEFVTDAGVELLGNMQALRSLDLSGCAVGDAGLASLGNNPNFRNISLSECNQITDVGIQKMCSRLLLLETLDISYCDNVTDYATKFLAFSCRELVRLNIAGCTQLTDTSVSYISGGCHYLSHLNMSNIANMTDKALRFLRRGCKLLQRLNVTVCPAVTYGAIQRVESGGCVVSHSIDVKEMKLGPILPLSQTHKRPMSVGYSIFPIPNHA